MGGTKIEFNKKKRYTLTAYSCKNHFTEKGQYTQLGNIVSLKPNKKGVVLSRFLMDNATIFANDYFLIAKKEQIGDELDRFAKEEVFLYFLKM